MQTSERFSPAGRFKFWITRPDILTVGAHYRGATTSYESEWFDNLVVNVGRTYMSGAALISVTQITSWYVGLIASGASIAAADTMASHAGWTELTGYSQATRVAFTGAAGGTAGQITNTASPAAFSINAGSQTIGGLFLVSNSTKSGTTGTLFAAGAAASLALPNPSTLNAVYDFGW